MAMEMEMEMMYVMLPDYALWSLLQSPKTSNCLFHK